MNNELQTLNTVAKVTMTTGNFEIEGYNELKQAIETEVAKYDRLMIAYDDKKSIKSGKDSLAELNKISKTIDDYRKTYKKAYNEPLSEFEATMNELKAIADEGANKIKQALDEVEERRKTERQTEVQAMIDELSEGYSVIFDAKWLNATAKDTKIRMAIVEQVEQAKQQEAYKQEQAKVISALAEDYGQQPDGWVAMLDHEPVSSILEKIRASAKAEQEKQARFEELQKRNEETLQVEELQEKTPSEQYAEHLFGEWLDDEEEAMAYDLKIEMKAMQKQKLIAFCQSAGITILNMEETTTDDEVSWLFD